MAIVQEVVDDYQSMLGPLQANPARTQLPAIPLRLLVSAKSFGSQMRRKPARVSRNQRPSIQTQQPVILKKESEIRPRRMPLFAVAASAAAVVAALGLVAGPVTLDWARKIPGFVGLITPAHAYVAPRSSTDIKTVEPKADARSLGYTPPVVAPASDMHPATPAPATNAAPGPRRARIQIHAGDTLHDLATKYLGSKDRTVELIRANPEISDPNLIYVGQIVYLPPNRKNDPRE
jgi:hypothetical protein